ncbi:hypothetical protein QOZ98_000162 [Planomicrobium stackebrandtii]|uniref:Uncharacterized protein n=1 Tax=Planomicrobium stackebrandtii TaxID=253160 RepID=A0ABU0GPP9_9BACL|nr:hypothetical protein [Planomicrobium stackebrandtii]
MRTIYVELKNLAFIQRFGRFGHSSRKKPGKERQPLPDRQSADGACTAHRKSDERVFVIFKLIVLRLSQLEGFFCMYWNIPFKKGSRITFLYFPKKD